MNILNFVSPESEMRKIYQFFLIVPYVPHGIERNLGYLANKRIVDICKSILLDSCVHFIVTYFLED